MRITGTFNKIKAFVVGVVVSSAMAANAQADLIINFESSSGVNSLGGDYVTAFPGLNLGDHMNFSVVFDETNTNDSDSDPNRGLYTTAIQSGLIQTNTLSSSSVFGGQSIGRIEIVNDTVDTLEWRLTSFNEHSGFGGGHVPLYSRGIIQFSPDTFNGDSLGQLEGLDLSNATSVKNISIFSEGQLGQIAFAHGKGTDLSISEAAAVPEPSSFAMVSLAALIAAYRRRRSSVNGMTNESRHELT